MYTTRITNQPYCMTEWWASSSLLFVVWSTWRRILVKWTMNLDWDCVRVNNLWTFVLWPVQVCKWYFLGPSCISIMASWYSVSLISIDKNSLAVIVWGIEPSMNMSSQPLLYSSARFLAMVSTYNKREESTVVKSFFYCVYVVVVGDVVCGEVVISVITGLNPTILDLTWLAAALHPISLSFLLRHLDTQ